MAASEFEKTPAEKAAHAATQFGTDSLYTRALNILAGLVGESPTFENVEKALSLVERWVDHKLEIKSQS